MNTPEIRQLLTLILWGAESIETDGRNHILGRERAKRITQLVKEVSTALGLDKADAEIEAAKVAEIERKNV